MRELRVWPSSPNLSFLVGPSNAALLDVYDRGMDLIGRNAEKLQPIYEKSDRWLLDY